MSNRKPTDVIDAGDLRKYRTEIPNSIDDMGLSVYAFRLYAHLKRVAGDSGQCYQGKRKMAEVCAMSPAMIPNAKRELIDRGLIRVTPGDAKTQTADLIVIVDIWRENFAAFAKSDPGHTVTTPGQDVTTPGHTVDGAGHTVDPKKEPLKKEPSKKEQRAAALPPAVPPAVVVFCDVHHRNPSKAQYPKFEHVTDLEQWRNVCETWRDRGYRPTNIAGQFEWYADPSKMDRRNGYQAQPSKVKQSMQAFDEMDVLLAEKGVVLP